MTDTKGPSLLVEEIEDRLHHLIELHSRAMNGAACQVCLVADGWSRCTTRDALADVLAAFHLLTAKGSS